jgi:hypothetical protein
MGASIKELQSLGGHRSLAVLQKYIEKANMDQQRTPHLFEGLDLPRLYNPSALN